MTALEDYSWPGNVRELQNYIERAVVMAEGEELTLDLLPAAVTGASRLKTGAHKGSLIEDFIHNEIKSTEEKDDAKLYNRVIEDIERELFSQILDGCNKNQSRAAKWLGINRNTLSNKIKTLGLNSDDNES